MSPPVSTSSPAPPNAAMTCEAWAVVGSKESPPTPPMNSCEPSANLMRSALAAAGLITPFEVKQLQRNQGLLRLIRAHGLEPGSVPPSERTAQPEADQA